MLTNSSSNQRVSVSRIESFLEALANARDPQALSTLPRDYKDFLPAGFPSQTATSKAVLSLPGYEQFPEMATRAAKLASAMRLDEFAAGLRRAWDEPDERVRRGWISRLRVAFHDEMYPDDTSGPPGNTAFDVAMDYWQEISARAKHCGNHQCDRPYFIAAKRSVKYCSGECAAPAQKAFKREWWAEHGPGWRKRRAEKELKESRRKHGKK